MEVQSLNILTLVSDHLTACGIEYCENEQSIHVPPKQDGKYYHIFSTKDALLIWQFIGEKDNLCLCHLITLAEPDSLDQLVNLIYS